LADVDETFLVRIRTSPVLEPWPATRVTVLGDAIHAMSPAGGSGANTALRDAAELCRALTEAGPGDLAAAVGRYEDRMRDYGYATLTASARAEAERGALRHPVTSWFFRRLGRA
jgi:2-polyprenyl-6-methoxyphenol hydroxylase-like FAD-dependent oxidoreductase